MSSKIKKLSILFLVLILVISIKYFGLESYFQFENLKSQKDLFKVSYSENTLIFLISFFLVYIISVALSIPGAATILTLGAGAIFGVSTGVLVVSFASTIGATISFLFSRYLFRDTVQEKFESTFKTINKGFDKEGIVYLLSLRLIPAFPFFLINLLMGLTNISIFRFYIISQLGMLPGTIVYVNAGTTLSTLNSTRDILTPEIFFSFLALGILPLFGNFIISIIKNKKLYSKFSKPKNFDYNLIVLGGGAAGLVSSYIGSTVKAKVALVESHKMGGDCLNYGCVPSKALLSTAKKIHLSKNYQKYGLKNVSIDYDFTDVMQRIKNIIKKIEPNDSIERYTGLGVDCFTGYGKVLSPFEIQVNDKIITSKNIIIATGASPVIPKVPGIKDISYVTSETIWNLKSLPKKFLVIGAGAIGCELAQGFSRLGSEVTLVEMSDRLLPREDRVVSEFMEKIFKSEGINILTSYKLLEFTNVYGITKAILEKGRETIEVPFDTVLFSIGRKPRVSGFGLEELGINLTSTGRIEVNEYLETNYPNIFACGDVSGPFQFTHTAAHEAWYASVNALFGIFKKFKADYSVIPWTIFTDPEIAHVGLTEEDAKTKNLQYDTTEYEISELDRAITESENKGFIRVLTQKNSDRILGVTIVGLSAGEVLSEYIIAMKHNIGLNKVLSTIHSYPTMSEANKYVAGSWKKNRKPEKILKFLQKFHAFRR